MYSIRQKFALQSIRNKIVVAFLFGCLVAFSSWIIARVVFKETFSTIESIAEPNPKLVLVNRLFQKIHRLDQVQKLQVLKFPNKPYAAFTGETKLIVELLDSLKTYCASDTFQLSRIGRMQAILNERDDLFRNYLNFRNSLSFSKDMRGLSDYISQNIKKSDSGMVRTTRKNTTTSTLLDAERQNKAAEKKESLFKRLFSRKKNNKETKNDPAKKLVTEDVQVSIDTFAISQRDSFIRDMEHAISAIEKKQSKKGSGLINHELKLTAASNIFIDELQQLLHQIQQEEIRDLQGSTESLSDVFNTAFNRVGIILVIFFTLTLILIFLMFSDISQSNKTRLQLIEDKERAEHLEQVKHRFLSNMSHEIRTPLQAIIGYAEQVKDQEKPEKEAIEAIYRSSGHLLQIVNEVLDYSRIVSGKFIFERQDFDIEELLAEVSDTMEGQAEKKNVRFKFKSEVPANVLYAGDAFRLKQILYNLLGNAIKFTHQGEVSFFITSRDLGSRKTEFTFEIKDTGIGMTEQELARVFQSFEQAGESTQRQYGGTGLGLSIAKTLAEMQGGTITVQSEKGKGSAFTLKLGYLKSLAKKEDAVLPLVQGRPVYKGKVLVVDDDEFILQLCSAILQKHNIPHLYYSSPQELLLQPWDNEVTLVLMDIRMPGISGYELYKQLKSRVSPRVKFVALTAQALPEEKAAILRQGFDQVLLKPFREKELLDLFAQEQAGDTEEPGSFTDRFDLSSIEVMCMNDKSLLKTTLRVFVEQSSLDLHALQEAIKTVNPKKISEICHRLAAKMGQIGLNALCHRLRSVEKNAMDLSTFTMDKNLFNKLIMEIEAATYKVKEYIHQL